MATNGLQLAIKTSAGSHETVNGTNQNNQHSEWHGVADKHGVAFTRNWWWKGPVEILSAHGRTRANVPQISVSDTYTVDTSFFSPPVHLNL